LWRVAHNSLPFKLNIKRRGILLDTKCPVSARFDEDGAHCFLKCKAVRQCWRELGMESIRTQILTAPTAEECIMEVVKLENHARIMVAVLLWRWWDVRNKVNAGELMPSSPETVWAVISLAQDILKDEDNTSPSATPKIQKWSVSPLNYLKINVDSAYQAEFRKGA